MGHLPRHDRWQSARAQVRGGGVGAAGGGRMGAGGGAWGDAGGLILLQGASCVSCQGQKCCW